MASIIIGKGKSIVKFLERLGQQMGFPETEVYICSRGCDQQYTLYQKGENSAAILRVENSGVILETLARRYDILKVLR